MSFWESIERFVARVGGYDPTQARAQQKFAATCVFIGSVGVVSLSTVSLLWRLGVAPKLLPEPIEKRVTRIVDRIAMLTEPPRITVMNRSAATHMVDVYLRTAVNFGISFVGVAAFFRYPYFPMPLSIGATLVPAFLVTCLSADHVNPGSRQLLTALCAFSCGYSFGPVNWIAYDTTIFAGVSAIATCAGFAMSAVITRGKVSFFAVSQLLSASLAVIGTNSVMQTTNAFQKLSAEHRTGSVVANVNSVLMLQLLSNVALAALHSLPTLYRFEAKALEQRKYKREHNIADFAEAELPAEYDTFGNEDPDKEAMFIFGAASYALWTWFRHAFATVIAKLSGKNTKAARDARRSKYWHELKNVSEGSNIDRVSNIGASITFLFFYVRFVGYLQQTANVEKSLDFWRRIFTAMAPMTLVA